MPTSTTTPKQPDLGRSAATSLEGGDRATVEVRAGLLVPSLSKARALPWTR